MADSVINTHNVLLGFRAALVADASITALLGSSPLRMYTVVPKDVVFPFVRIDTFPSDPITGVRSGGTFIKWVRRLKLAFVVYTLDRSTVNAAAIIVALQLFMDSAPAVVTFTGGKVFEAIPRFEQPVDYDPDVGGAFGSIEYDFGLTP